MFGTLPAAAAARVPTTPSVAGCRALLQRLKSTLCVTYIITSLSSWFLTCSCSAPVVSAAASPSASTSLRRRYTRASPERSGASYACAGARMGRRQQPEPVHELQVAALALLQRFCCPVHHSCVRAQARLRLARAAAPLQALRPRVLRRVHLRPPPPPPLRVPPHCMFHDRVVTRRSCTRRLCACAKSAA